MKAQFFIHVLDFSNSTISLRRETMPNHLYRRCDHVELTSLDQYPGIFDGVPIDHEKYADYDSDGKFLDTAADITDGVQL